MVSIRVANNSDKLSRQMARASRRIADQGPLLDDIGAAIERSTDQRMAREQAPDGSPWQDLSPNTWASKRNRRKLNETGQMRDSLSYQASQSEVIIGFADKKARWHQFGTRPYTIRPKNKRVLRFMTPGGPVFRSEVRHPGIPARPILGITREDENEIQQLVGEHITRALE